MGDTMERAGSYWARVTERAERWQQAYRYEIECRAAHVWAVETMGS